jgi:hypothetical protein
MAQPRVEANAELKFQGFGELETPKKIPPASLKADAVAVAAYVSADTDRSFSTKECSPVYLSNVPTLYCFSGIAV